MALLSENPENDPSPDASQTSRSFGSRERNDSSSPGIAKPRVSVVPDELNQAFLEFKLMLRYVLGEGIVLDPPTQASIFAVQDYVSKAVKVSAAADNAAPDYPDVVVAPEENFPANAPAPVVAPAEPAFAESLIAAHNALATLIAPATPLSLAATEPGPRFGYLSNPPLIRWMILIALISVVGFLVTSIALDISK